MLKLFQDNLERQAGVQRVLQCHGSFATASCLQCRIRVPGADIEEDLLKQNVPLCKVCNAPPPKPAASKKSKRRKSGWDSDQSDEPDQPLFPPGIMKVQEFVFARDRASRSRQSYI